VEGRLLKVCTCNILKGNWNIRLYVDDKATAPQRMRWWPCGPGKKGGPVADLAKLVGRVDAIEQVPITFQVQASRAR
jgi:hypothetical protein